MKPGQHEGAGWLAETRSMQRLNLPFQSASALKNQFYDSPRFASFPKAAENHHDSPLRRLNGKRLQARYTAILHQVTFTIPHKMPAAAIPRPVAKPTRFHALNMTLNPLDHSTAVHF
jgi:hypothetical protein